VARAFKLTLQYDGTDYVGWQRQAIGTSIQGLVEDALQPIEGGPVTVHGAGRTDAGVHALGQVCSFKLTATIDPSTLARALNAVLPPDVRVASAEEAPDGFHARFDAAGKVYDYRIVNGPFISPFVRRYAWHVIPLLDVPAMQEAAQVVVGEHDFSTFRGAGSEAHTSVRTITRIAWSGSGGAGDPLTIRFEGNGFLRHMVRSIAGTLVEIGLRRWPTSVMKEILESRDRTRAGKTAPAQGLFLIEVCY
jgi:tRNA pseudouridine38-40 synthase